MANEPLQQSRGPSQAATGPGHTASSAQGSRVSATRHFCHKPGCEHSVPFLWPLAAAIELGQKGLELFTDNLKFLAEAGKIIAPVPSEWATPNRILLDLDTMRLRDFSPGNAATKQTPVIIVAPYAGHSATIADYARGQSLVETLLSAGLHNVLVTDWKPATPEMKDFDIDKYLSEINAVVDDLGGEVILVGLCQGGWMSSMYAARFPHKVRAMVLAGSPMDTEAGDGSPKHTVKELPASFYSDMVNAGAGMMRGQAMLAGWKNMHPGEQYLGKFIDLYEHVKDEQYLKRTDAFERWYENPVDLPGRYYLQAINLLFRENQLARGNFTALGRRITLRDIRCPLYLLAGDPTTSRPRSRSSRRRAWLGPLPRWSKSASFQAATLACSWGHEL
jgi:poly(3-hydroxybutyrate) depolymerase